ncbi:MAG: hypothetical protein COT26_01210 [Candidatus Kerfeldbacteria bacterium CG08_land_8_20_14_0_20_43_14]|uniref:GIY-YIG domain-containing protein n=1 Tax=Candidatus Kerfeldbacteria bacterium CG08_land_8_20_14_0_20_43_14 TaxID=2014246 RepID=A0A2H0YSV0_9BACT|nr:MAG: hypothetical protein COT26_01210 [Candidatus Kerfeldbacteria bacterium CG08_land_8_20_14_0_20_43_14]
MRRDKGLRRDSRPGMNLGRPVEPAPSNDGMTGRKPYKYMHYFVYILLLSNKRLYTGFTGNLNERLIQHQNDEVKSTAHRRALKLIHYEVYLKESDARRRGKFLKTTEGKRLLKMQIRDLLNEIQGLHPRKDAGVV